MTAFSPPPLGRTLFALAVVLVVNSTIRLSSPLSLFGSNPAERVGGEPEGVEGGCAKLGLPAGAWPCRVSLAEGDQRRVGTRGPLSGRRASRGERGRDPTGTPAGSEPGLERGGDAKIALPSTHGFPEDPKVFGETGQCVSTIGILRLSNWTT